MNKRFFKLDYNDIFPPIYLYVSFILCLSARMASLLCYVCTCYNIYDYILYIYKGISSNQKIIFGNFTYFGRSLVTI